MRKDPLMMLRIQRSYALMLDFYGARCCSQIIKKNINKKNTPSCSTVTARGSAVFCFHKLVLADLNC